jgi:AcrR family transcriptional regulator
MTARDDERVAEVLHPTSDVARQMIDATVAIIDADGEAAVRVKDIVEAAGVQVPVLYRHFGSREGLVQAAQVERLVRDIDAQLDEVTAAIAQIDTIDEFRMMVDMILSSLADPARKRVRFQRLSVLGSAYGRPALVAEVARLQALYLEATAALLRRPQELGWLAEDLNVDAFASWFAGQMLGRVMIEFGEPIVEEGEYDAIVNDAVKHILFGKNA